MLSQLNLYAPVRTYGAFRIIAMNPLYKQIIRSTALGTLAIAAVMFIPAGTLNYWQGWAYLGTFILRLRSIRSISWNTIPRF